MDLSIIIVSWNVREKLKDNLRALYESQNVDFEIFVVDNNSADGTALMIKKDYPRVNLITNSENLGFARANNQAIKLAMGRYILLLNPDMRVFDDTLSSMISWLDRHDDTGLWEHVEDIPDEAIWHAHRWLKSKLISFIQNRSRERWSEDRVPPVQALALGALLDADVLTLGFSRRFTDYKRGALILSDTARLKRILRDQLRPIQIIFAGKAHPNDHAGKCLIQQIYNIAGDPEFGGRIAFVEDYDMHVARFLVQGVDVWLNTPRPLQEASGTSGMKASLNGVPHLSVPDGWWPEGYNGANGWVLGQQEVSPEEEDKADALSLYQLLEEKIIPLYYERDRRGVPGGWIQVAKEAIRSITPLFCARRMLKEYAERMYVPAALSLEREQ